MFRKCWGMLRIISNLYARCTLTYSTCVPGAPQHQLKFSFDNFNACDKFPSKSTSPQTETACPLPPSLPVNPQTVGQFDALLNISKSAILVAVYRIFRSMVVTYCNLLFVAKHCCLCFINSYAAALSLMYIKAFAKETMTQLLSFP